MRRFQNYIKEVIQEMGKVSWPSWEELKGSTLVVLAFSAITAVFVTAVDFVLSKLIEKVI